MSALKLLQENSAEVETLVEQSSQGKKYFIEGRYLQGGRKGIHEDKNKNGRIYLEEVLDLAAGKFITEKVASKQGFGELNHPTHPQVNPERIAIVIESLKKDGMHYIGKSRVAEGTPMGQIVIGVMEAGGRLGVSSRALGSLKEEAGIKYVQSDLVISAIDVVSDPSGQGCFVNSIMENVSWEMLNDGTVRQIVEDGIKKRIDEEKALKAFSELLIKFGSSK